MFLLLIIVAIIIAWYVPWVFRYLFIAPLLGTCTGLFAWGVLGLLTGGLLFSAQAAGMFIILGYVFAAYVISKAL